MFIQRVVVKNYRCLQTANVTLNAKLNVIVGDNECGKSTLLEATNLALTGQLNGRPLLIELHPYLFNLDLVHSYIESLMNGAPPEPPSILIEVYLADDPALTKLRGTTTALGLISPVLDFSLNRTLRMRTTLRNTFQIRLKFVHCRSSTTGLNGATLPTMKLSTPAVSLFKPA